MVVSRTAADQHPYRDITCAHCVCSLDIWLQIGLPSGAAQRGGLKTVKFTSIYTDTMLVIVVIPDYDSGVNKGMVLTDTVWEGN